MGGAVWFVARSGAVRRLVPGLVLAALVGLAGGVVLTAWAGARRTDTAYERLAAGVHHADLLVTADGDPAAFDPSIATDGPGVASAGVVRGFAAVPVQPDGTLDFGVSSSLLAPVDTTVWYDLDRPLLAAGRLPAPDAPDEFMVPEVMGDLGFPIGSEHDLCVVDLGAAFAFGQGIMEGTASDDQQRAFVAELCEVHRLTVVGLLRPGPDEVVLRADSEADLFPQAGPGVLATIETPEVFSFVLVELAAGADPEVFVDSVLDRTAPGGRLSVQSADLRKAVVDRTVEPYVRALTLFALVAALATVGVLGPTVLRWAGTPEQDRAGLLAVGLPSHQLRVASALRGAAVGVVAALVAMGVAIAASGRFPIGIVAGIEPYPGLRVDALVLAVGGAFIVALSTLFGALAPTREARSVRRPSKVAETLQSMGARPAPVAGVRAAMAGDGRGVSAARAAGGVAVALVAILTALTYQAGLVRLLDTPARYGWTWDAALEVGDEGVPDELRTAIDASPKVESMTVARRGGLLRDGAAVQTFSFIQQRGAIHPVILEGRAPQGAREIALGRQTMERLAAELGDVLTFRTPQGDPIELEVVGQTLLPLLSFGQDLSVAEGGLVDDVLQRRVTDVEPAIVLINLEPGSDLEDLHAELEPLLVTPFGQVPISGPEFTADLRGYDANRGTPVLLASVLAVLGVGVLAQTIAASARRRQRELAVLRSLGFVARDVRSTVRWNTLAVVGMCLAVSVPLGLALGRALWRSFARDIGLVADPVIPVPAALAVVLVTIVGAVVLAAIAGRSATRVRPAEALRTE